MPQLPIAIQAASYPSSSPQILNRLLRYGILHYGFARVRCPSCHDGLLVAFLCKNFGVCPLLLRKAHGRLGDTFWACVPPASRCGNGL